ncbi:hypothetical protein GGR56DRAFT_97828 [Xylariaceae sp. FL0804]|nr:hypothetical protein GGR56DRAFT_97828 [Xylariaceae sp. FL0804]
MVPAPPALPTRFPCWCRAVYSWGGESTRDLGFVEGDLIECLNAGDGSWWTGRLRRNKTVGVFPSNFVEILPDDFRPITRSISPHPASNTPSPTSSLQKPKSKPFRKPFEAYAKAPHYTTAKQPITYRDMSNTPPSQNSRQNSTNSFRNSVHDNVGRVPSPPEIRGYGSRAPSPARGYGSRAPSPAPHMSSYGSRIPSPPPSQRYDYNHRAPSPAPPHALSHVQRAPSPIPSPMPHYGSRAPSPAPSHSPYYGSRAPSPAPSFSFKPYRPGAEETSPPPPAPPPHRNLLTRGNSGNSHVSYEDRPPQGGYHTPRIPSPCPPSPAGPGGHGFTPSPLREAMDDVLDQLDALGMPHDNETAEKSFDPWSPESFDLVHHRSRRPAQARPQTAMGVPLQDSGYESLGGDSSQEHTMHGGYREEHQLPQLSNYVERMESRLRKMHQHSSSSGFIDNDMGPPPLPPLKGNLHNRSKSSMDDPNLGGRPLRKQKSLYEVGRLDRTATTKTTSTNTSSGTRATNSSTNTQSTNRSLMSGVSAGGISATSAGSLARKNRARSALGFRDGDEDLDLNRPTTPFSGVSYHPSHSTSAQRPRSQAGFNEDGIASIGGLVSPGGVKPKKANFIKRILEATKTGVASNRNSIAMGAGSLQSAPASRGIQSSSASRAIPNGLAAITGGRGRSNTDLSRDTARDMGLGGTVDWVQVRRDVNRSNTLSKNERIERRDRCMMLDYPAVDPVDELYESIEGAEGIDGLPVQDPVNYQAINLSQVDKNSRFVSSLPPMTTAVSLATTYVCRPYRSEVQRLRAIFTWVAEKINWEEDYEGEVDTRRVIQTKRACAEEYASLVHEMCAAVGIHSEIIRGYLKTPGEVPETSIMPRSNHWWNAVLIDSEWRMMDCCLASPSNPRRGLFSSAGSGAADAWWFLTSPAELCWTHVPEHAGQQHVCPPAAAETLLQLPGACPPFFRHGLALVEYNTSLTRIEDLEMVHVRLECPADVEVAAEVEARAFARDADGDCFESGDVTRKRALAQAEWFGGAKRYTIKALLPGDEGEGVLRVYAGRRGLMHSIKDVPHPLALALPVIHTGENPPYEFVARHPTPHAQRHDIYVVQPQCQRLALNNTFVFAIRQHPSSSSSSSSSGGGADDNNGRRSPLPFARPGSAMSMTSGVGGGGGGGGASSSVTSAPSSATGSVAGRKPAKLAIQTPGGKILRLMRKDERKGGGGFGGGGFGVGRGADADDDDAAANMGDGGTWETIIKCSEAGVWRGLVLADRTARWCVFAEWVCVG